MEVLSLLLCETVGVGGGVIVAVVDPDSDCEVLSECETEVEGDVVVVALGERVWEAESLSDSEGEAEKLSLRVSLTDNVAITDGLIETVLDSVDETDTLSE